MTYSDISRTRRLQIIFEIRFAALNQPPLALRPAPKRADDIVEPKVAQVSNVGGDMK